MKSIMVIVVSKILQEITNMREFILLVYIVTFILNQIYTLFYIISFVEEIRNYAGPNTSDISLINFFF